MVGIVLLAFALRVYHIDFQSLWRDEVDALRFATRPLSDLIATFRNPGENGPLYFLLLRGWLAAVGRSEFALRSLPLLAGVLAVPLSFALGQRLIGSRPALLGTMLVATSPYLVWYSQEAKMYALAVSLVLAALCSFSAALAGKGWTRWLLTWLFTTLAIYVHLLSVLLIVVLVCWFAVEWLQRPAARRHTGPMLLVLALLTLPYLPIVRWQLVLWLQESFQTGHAVVSPTTMLASLLWGFSRGVQGSGSLWTLLPTVFVLLAGAALGWGRNGGGVRESADANEEAPSRPRVLQAAVKDHLPQFSVVRLLLWLVLPVLGLYIISLRKPLFTDRYLIWIAPAFYLLLARGMWEMGKRWRLLAVVLGTVLLALNLQALWSQAHTIIKSDFRAASAFVEERQAPEDLLLFVMPYVRHPYSYYSGQPLSWADPPYTNSGATEAEVDVEMSRITDNHPVVWLIQSEEDAWDRRSLARAWLDEHGALNESAEFVRVQVARYDLTTAKDTP